MIAAVGLLALWLALAALVVRAGAALGEHAAVAQLRAARERIATPARVPAMARHDAATVAQRGGAR